LTSVPSRSTTSGGNRLDGAASIVLFRSEAGVEISGFIALSGAVSAD